jgi:hypothetical protein
MNFIRTRCIAGAVSAARGCMRNYPLLSGLLVLAIVGPSFASVDRPAFQGAAAPKIGGGSGGSTAGFDINLIYNNAPTAGELAAFSAAEATWESLIQGYQIDDIFSTTVTINVFLNPIDGFGGILGSAGPTFAKLNAAQNAVTSTFLYTDEGDMQFDTADTANYVGLGLFDDIILHEMGHVLGIGTLWSGSAVGFPGRQENYIFNSGQYTGPAGLAAYNAEFGQSGTFVPVELGGGAGTANGHWNEVNGGAGFTGIVSNIEPGPFNDMRYELMTGWLNTPSLFISSLSVQSLEDLGYMVVPEPSGILLCGMGMLIVGFRRRGR